MPARLFLDATLAEGLALTLPPEPARHVQVLRMQPGDALIVFNGQGGEWAAEVTRMGRSEVDLRIGPFLPCQRELPLAVTLAVGMPANERMDALIEKATELGALAIQPLICARSVLRLAGERAEKRRAHWQGVAVAAAEQSGRTVVPQIAPIASLEDWLARLGAEPPASQARCVLSLAADARPLLAAHQAFALAGKNTITEATAAATFLSGPEGGLAEHEEALARRSGFGPVSLGPRVLRADTAPLAALACLGIGLGLG